MINKPAGTAPAPCLMLTDNTGETLGATGDYTVFTGLAFNTVVNDDWGMWNSSSLSITIPEQGYYFMVMTWYNTKLTGNFNPQFGPALQFRSNTEGPSQVHADENIIHRQYNVTVISSGDRAFSFQVRGCLYLFEGDTVWPEYSNEDAPRLRAGFQAGAEYLHLIKVGE